MNTTDLDHFLGEFAATVTEDQREKMLEISDIADTVFPHEDQRDDRMEMFSTAVQVILGDTSTEDVVSEWKAAMATLATATARMRGAIALEVSTSNESQVADRYGMNRGTVRKAVGK